MTVVRSCISKELKAQTVKKGAIYTIAGGGTLFLLAFLPFSMIQGFGLVFFLVSCVLIAIGLVPYRKLLLLELHPFEVHITDQTVILLQKKSPLFEIEIKDIEHFNYYNANCLYGIKMRVKRPVTSKIKVLTRKSRFFQHVRKWQKRVIYGELFLPYFSEFSYNEVKEALDQVDLLQSDHACE